MKTINSLEDLFIAFSDAVVIGAISHQPQDHKPVMSFRTLLKNLERPTEKQAKFMIILLNKYSNQMNPILDTDVKNLINNLKWSSPFREMDYSKSIELSKDEHGLPVFYLKFPFNLKEEFDELLPENKSSLWLSDKKVRKVYPLDINPIKFMDFLSKYNFKLDPIVADFFERVEEVWELEDEICPCSMIENNQVVLKNAPIIALEYFQEHRKNILEADLLLARTLGYCLNEELNTPIGKICQSHDTNLFHLTEMDKLVGVINNSDATTFVMLDRQSDVKDWIEKFIDSCKRMCYNIDKIRVCFRASNKTEEGKEFNQWIKDLGLGGDIESGKVFIFKHTFSKWVYDKDNSDLIVTNSIYQPSNMSTNHFVLAHPTVLFVGEHKPSLRKENNKIVEV